MAFCVAYMMYDLRFPAQGAALFVGAISNMRSAFALKKIHSLRLIFKIGGYASKGPNNEESTSKEIENRKEIVMM